MFWAGLLFVVLILSATLFVGRYGTRWERLGIGIVLLGSLLTLAVAAALESRWVTTAYTILVIDFAAMMAFGFIALRSDRFWPLWVTGMQLAQMTTHLARMANSDIVPKAYEAGQGVWSWLQILVIVLATWSLRARTAKPMPPSSRD